MEIHNITEATTEPEYVTQAQAARLAGLKVPHLHYYINKGAFCQVHEIAERPHYLKADVLAWVKPHPEKRGRPLGVKNHGKTQES